MRNGAGGGGSTHAHGLLFGEHEISRHGPGLAGIRLEMTRRFVVAMHTGPKETERAKNP